jgi:DNA-directed RNA polymerase subunit M/transcription elongation factor TFIIS
MIGVSNENIDIGVEIYNGDLTLDKITTQDKADFSECPSCKSADILYDMNGIEPESIFIYRTHKCNKCGTVWEERYDLSQVRIYKNDED